MSVTIKVGCKADHANVALFENSLFPLFQEMLVADVQGKSNNDRNKNCFSYITFTTSY